MLVWNMSPPRLPCCRYSNSEALQRVEQRDASFFLPVLVDHRDVVDHDRLLDTQVLGDGRLACQHPDLPVRRDLEVVVRPNQRSPDQLRVLVQLDQPLAFEDRQQVTVAEQVHAPPPLAAAFVVSLGRLGKGPFEVVRPAVQLVALHVDEVGLGCVAGGVEVEAGVGPGLVVKHDTRGAVTSLAREPDVAERFQSLDLLALLFRQLPRVRLVAEPPRWRAEARESPGTEADVPYPMMTQTSTRRRSRTLRLDEQGTEGFAAQQRFEPREQLGGEARDAGQSRFAVDGPDVVAQVNRDARPRIPSPRSEHARVQLARGEVVVQPNAGFAAADWRAVGARCGPGAVRARWQPAGPPSGPPACALPPPPLHACAGSGLRPV